MCGRASQRLTEDFALMIAHFTLPDILTTRNNLRPTEPAWIVARRGDGVIRTLRARWWCQREGGTHFETKYPTFNARVDTMHERRLWSDLLRRGQRCLFPVSSFYEWPTKGKGLPPVEIFVEGRKPYALAGLWSRYTDEGSPFFSFAVFTTAPNDFMLPIHEKAMPVIISDIRDQERWLTDGDEELLVPYKGILEADKLDSTLEKLYPNENAKR
ncbi:MAG: SOS response-associated peptidase family protein [Acidobacteria bacterium]|nr:SOS response-associated peptidase family protein [Acidobacteriota bacterium]